MLVVENTHERVVGTVHLVTNENFFVAKSSAPLTMLYINPALFTHSRVLHWLYTEEQICQTLTSLQPS